MKPAQLITCLWFSALASADITLSIPMAGQQLKQWCWVACAQAMASSKDINFTQCQIASLALTGHRDGCQDYKRLNHSGTVQEALGELGIDCKNVWRPLTFDEIEAELKKGHPVAARVMPPGYERAHFVLIYGIERPHLIIWDPGKGGRSVTVTKHSMEKVVGRWVNTVSIGDASCPQASPDYSQRAQAENNHR